MPEPLRAVGYIRVSTIAQTEGASPDVQREEIKRWVDYENTHELVKIYSDMGISGSSSERPAFQQLMADARSHVFDMVIVTKFSRFARSLSIMAKALEELEQLQIRFVSLFERYDSGVDSPAAKLIRNILMSLAEFEKEQIRETMASGKYYKWSAKKIWVGGLPYGYTFNKETCQLEPIPEKLEVYKKIVGMYVDESLSLSQILDRLREEGIKCKNQDFSKPVLSNIFKSTVYKGFYLANQYNYSDKTRRNDSEKHKAGTTYKVRDRQKLKPPEELIRWEVEPVISDARWEAIQSRIQLNRHSTKRRENMGVAWLRDRLKCAICGAPIKPRAPGRRDKLPIKYQCYWSKAPVSELKASGRKRCPLPAIDLYEINDYVWGKILLRLWPWSHAPNSDLARLVGRDGSKSRAKELREQLKPLQAQLIKKQNAMDNMLAMLEMNEMSATQRQTFIQRLAVAETEVTTLANKVRVIEGELGNISQRREQALAAIEELTRNKQAAKALFKTIENASDEHKHLIINEMMSDPIEVDKSDREPGWEVLHFYLRIFPTASIKKIIDFTNTKADPIIGSKVELGHCPR
jgi:DNA invertase Pin-like site-specific DNA recombinase